MADTKEAYRYASLLHFAFVEGHPVQRRSRSLCSPLPRVDWNGFKVSFLYPLVVFGRNVTLRGMFNKQCRASTRGYSPIIFSLIGIFLVGCYSTQHLSLKQPNVTGPVDKRSGQLKFVVLDKRADKEFVGAFRGGFGNKVADIALKENLEESLATGFKGVLTECGYTVVPESKLALEAEVKEFRAESDGWSKHASQKIRFHLRAQNGEILWERVISAEDGGMVFGVGSIEQSMNVAFDRLLKSATEEFSSEFFAQKVRKSQ
jgi:hypothetical protein